MIDCTLTHKSRPEVDEPIRLVTTLLDPVDAPADENVFDEMKTHQRVAGRVLRSKFPEMVIQEIYAHLLVYFAIRSLINRAAKREGLDPDRV